MHFAVKLRSVRPTFPMDITEAEREVMGEHLAYWNALMARGHVLVFGPVFDPEGLYGLGIIQADSEAHVQELFKDDPAITGGLVRLHVSMMQAITP